MSTLSPLVLLAALAASPALTAAQELTPIPLTPAMWTATDSLRFEEYLGRPSLYINKGVALARGIELTDGVIEFEMAATPRTTFLGAAFHATRPDFAEIIFFRPGQSGTSDAIQCGPAMNNLGAAWQVYHGEGANAATEITRERWRHVRIELAGGTARLFLDRQTEPVLTVPRLAGTGGGALGVWTGLFGRGAHYSNFAYRRATPATAAHVAPAAGVLMEWDLSEAVDAARVRPGVLPDLETLTWQRVRAEPQGFVLVNRYHAAPVASIPFDPETRIIYVDSVMGGRVRGTKVVFARHVIEAEQAGYRRMHISYSDGVVVYANAQPLFFGMNAQFFRGDGIMTEVGDAVYLPLERGRNEIVLAVTEYTGGWAFRARLDPELIPAPSRK